MLNNFSRIFKRACSAGGISLRVDVPWKPPPLGFFPMLMDYGVSRRNPTQAIAVASHMTIKDNSDGIFTASGCKQAEAEVLTVREALQIFCSRQHLNYS